MLKADYSSAFQRDIKRLKKKHTDFSALKEVIRLVLEDTDGRARMTKSCK